MAAAVLLIAYWRSSHIVVLGALGLQLVYVAVSVCAAIHANGANGVLAPASKSETEESKQGVR